MNFMVIFSTHADSTAVTNDVFGIVATVLMFGTFVLLTVLLFTGRAKLRCAAVVTTAVAGKI